jgi:uroporphyrinogen-III decarboxylase
MKRASPPRARATEIDRRKYFLSVSHPYFLYENGFNILGAEEFLASLLLEPDAAHAFLDILLDFELGVAERYVELSPDQVCTMDDYGMQDRLIVSPAVWRTFFKPRLARLYDFYRAELGPEVVISHHSCGHVMPILADLIEIGVNVFNPIQSTANDLAELRRVTSRRLTLAGGIDGQRVLPLGTPDDVRVEVGSKLEMLWEGGGYLPMPEKTLGVSDANLRAVEEAVVAWSARHVEVAPAGPPRSTIS